MPESGSNLTSPVLGIDLRGRILSLLARNPVVLLFLCQCKCTILDLEFAIQWRHAHPLLGSS